MAISENQSIGAIAEKEVDLLFASWHWNSGRDFIDDGIDLFVEPRRETFGGHRFLVQVKGTARRKSGTAVVAPVAKSRLREYASMALPVFIVRRTADGELYWLHAQEYFRTHPKKLSGSGMAGVVFSTNQNLRNKQLFEEYLRYCIRANSAEIIPKIEAIEKALLLQNADARISVTADSSGRGTRFSLHPKEPIHIGMHFTLDGTSDNLLQARDAIEFGLGRTFSVHSFGIEGSEAFKSLGVDGTSRGDLHLSTEAICTCTVKLQPGLKTTISTDPLVLKAELFRGLKGGAVTNESRDSTIDFSARFSIDSNGGILHTTLGVRWSSLAQASARDAFPMRLLHKWCEQVLASDSFTIEFCSPNFPRFSVAVDNAIERIGGAIDWAALLAKVHLICDATNSDFVFPAKAADFRVDDSLVDLAFALLKGERKLIKIDAVDFASERQISFNAGDSFVCTTSLNIDTPTGRLCSLPVRIDFSDFCVEPNHETGGFSLRPGSSGEAWLSHNFPPISER